MRPGHALDAMLFDHAVEHAAGATVGIADEDVLVALRFGLLDRLVHRRCDAVRIEVELGRQAGQFEMVETEPLLDGQNFARNHPAGNDQKPVCLIRLLFLRLGHELS